MLDISIKQHIRDFFEARMAAAKMQAGALKQGAIVVLESDLERFIDDMWFAMQDAHKAKNDANENG